MKSIPKIIICCGLALAIVQGAIAAGETAVSSPEVTQDNRAATNPGVVVIDREQLKARLEERGVQAKKKRDLAKQKDTERKNSTPAAGN